MSGVKEQREQERLNQGSGRDASDPFGGLGQMIEMQIPSGRYPEVMSEEHWIPMPDGVRLHAMLHRPVEEGSYPVVLIRNPYVSNQMLIEPMLGPGFAKCGYALLHVNVRGALGSEGEWLPFENEREDGRAVIDWIAGQPWCDGNIGTFGASYLGHAQWCIADYQHPALKTMFISVYGVRCYETFYRRGMFRPDVWTAWASQMIEDNRYKMIMPQDMVPLFQEAKAVSPQVRLGEEMKGKICEWYKKWITNISEKDDYWSSGFWKELTDTAPRVQIPLFLHGGWFDVFLRSQLDSFRKLPEETKKKSRMVIGPWHHNGISGGDLNYPEEDTCGLFMIKAAVEWFDHHLKGMEYTRKTGVVEEYHIGENSWKTWEGDIHPASRKILYFNMPSVAPNVGKLSEEQLCLSEKASYMYNPAKPVETMGGTVLTNLRNPMAGPECSMVQPKVGYRQDVLSFLTEPLAEKLDITGSVEVHLFVSSDVPATAFAVKLCELCEDGRSFNIRDDITDIRWVDENTEEEYEPGTVRELTLRMTDCSWRLKAGSRLRIDISSSNFPAYHVHPNVKECWAETTQVRTAHQTIYFGMKYPARIILPIV